MDRQFTGDRPCSGESSPSRSKSGLQSVPMNDAGKKAIPGHRHRSDCRNFRRQPHPGPQRGPLPSSTTIFSNRTSTNRPCSMIRGAPLSPPPRTRSPTSLQAGHFKLETLCNKTSLNCSSYTGSELARLSALLVIYRYLRRSERRTVRHSRTRRQSYRDSGMAVAQLYSQPNVTAIDKTFSSRLFRLFQRERQGS